MSFKMSSGFHRAFKVFCKNTSINAYKYMVDEKRTLFERLMWFIINITFIIMTSYVVIILWDIFMENPTVTTLVSTNYPITNVPFPGVSICNLNKISKTKVEHLSRYLVSLNQSKQNYTEVLQQFEYLGSLYDFDAINIDDTLRFQTFLDTVEPLSNISLEIKSLMKYLYPSCEEILLSCRWDGVETNCSKLFRLHLTYEGYCCLFNYQKYSNNSGNSKPKLHYQDYGISRGLTVVVNNNLADYFYSMISAMGTKVHIFHPEDYPDPASGSFIDLLVPHNSESFISIIPSVIESDISVKKYPVNKRGCYFAKEKYTALGDYSQSDCFVDCRIKSMIDLCSCVAFMIPVEKQRICNLGDLICLNRYKQRWNTQMPIGNTDDRLKKEQRESVQCDEICYPTCNEVIYGVSITSNPFFDNVQKKVNCSNADGIIHIYFNKRFINFYKQDVVFEWFEILSYYGGIFGLFIGLSLISVVEIFVTFTFKWFHFARN